MRKIFFYLFLLFLFFNFHFGLCEEKQENQAIVNAVLAYIKNDIKTNTESSWNWSVSMGYSEVDEIIKTWQYKNKELIPLKKPFTKEEAHQTKKYPSYWFKIFQEERETVVMIRRSIVPLSERADVYKVIKDELGNIKLEYIRTDWVS